MNGEILRLQSTIDTQEERMVRWHKICNAVSFENFHLVSIIKKLVKGETLNDVQEETLEFIEKGTYDPMSR